MIWQRSVLDVSGTLEDARSVRKMMGRRVETQGSVKVDPEERAVRFEGTYDTSDGPKYLSVQSSTEPIGADRCRVVGPNYPATASLGPPQNP